jgi:hypothetical protein
MKTSHFSSIEDGGKGGKGKKNKKKKLRRREGK